MNIAVVSGLSAIALGLVLWALMKQKPIGTRHMRDIKLKIKSGARVFLHKEYEVLVFFAVAVAAILTLLVSRETALAFLIGALLSAAAGDIGMRVATSANARTANACRKSTMAGMKMAFHSGAVIGMMVTGLGILGIFAVFLVSKNPATLFGFGFGASAIALFARVGGGIYTKAADIGADVVGKLEKGMEEDDPRNPAVIADNVGDNVGDIAGACADFFESYVDSIIAATVVGISLHLSSIPLMIAGMGIIASIIGIGFVRGNEPGSAMNKGVIAAAGVAIALALLFLPLNIALSAITGLVAGVLTGFSSKYYTSSKHKPVLKIVAASKTGAPTNVITGLSVGMISTVAPVIIISAVIAVSYMFAGYFGIAIASVGMLSTLGITLAMATFGPISDNAGGIAEMAGMERYAVRRAAKLDELGNTTSAIGKGLSIGSAALTSIALFSAYIISANIERISLTTPIVFIGIFIGALMPFFFSSVTLVAVSRAASKIIKEARSQIRAMHKKEPDYKICIAISTRAGLKHMMLPALSAIILPIIVGALLGKEALGGLLIGAITSGFMLAVMMANSGGAWDNAKKYIESGHCGGKGSEAHKAAVVGDTVGDPLKDTAGPSISILIKLMCIVALVFVPIMP